MKKPTKPAAKRDRSHSRAPGSTVLGVSMSAALKAKIKAAAEKDGRTMANFCAHYLRGAVKQIERKGSPMIVALESPAENGDQKTN